MPLITILAPPKRRIKLSSVFFISSITFLAGIIVLIKSLAGTIEVMGYTSLILSVWFLGGIIMLMLGIIGLYIGKIFQSVKNRPIYIISAKENLE